MEKKIREQFKDIQPYQPRNLDTPPLNKFQPVTTKHLGKIINSMPSKLVPRYITNRLKQVLEACLPTITHIVNSLLDTGEFCKEWKEALFKLLIKKYQQEQLK